MRPEPLCESDPSAVQGGRRRGFNIGGETTYSAADALRARGIPFATGYSLNAIPERFAKLRKPFAFRSFEKTLRTALAGRPCHREASAA